MGNSCVGPTTTTTTTTTTKPKTGFFESVTAAVWRSRPPEKSPKSPNNDNDNNDNNDNNKTSIIPDHKTANNNNNDQTTATTKGGGTSHHVRRTSSMGLQVESVLGRKTENIKETYKVGRKLGQGQFGTTFMCVEKSTGKEYACKSIAKRKLVTSEDVEDVRREIQIMHHLAGHENVISIVGAYEDAVAVHVVMDLCEGGELFDRIIQRGHYTERKAADLARYIVGVVQACHSLGVMHRDLKPENFLFVNHLEDSTLKTIDFGLSVFFKPEHLRWWVTNKPGSLSYKVGASYKFNSFTI